MGPNNSFKPKPLRSGKNMAEKACHVFTSTTRFGLTQALGGKETLSVLQLLLAAAAGYAAYWLSLVTPGWRILKPFFGYDGYGSLKAMAKIMLWGWVVVFGLFIAFIWSGVGAWTDPSDGDKAMAILSAPFMAGVVAGYLHFLRIPVESWRR